MEIRLSDCAMECHSVRHVAGFGFRQSASVDSLLDAYRAASAQITGAVSAVATVADKSGHPAFVAVAQQLNLPILVVDQRDLVAQDVRSYSQTSLKTYETPSVAEASALAAAGTSSYLAGQRVISHDRRATCAIATTARNTGERS